MSSVNAGWDDIGDPRVSTGSPERDWIVVSPGENPPTPENCRFGRAAFFVNNSDELCFRSLAFRDELLSFIYSRGIFGPLLAIEDFKFKKLSEGD